MKIPKIATNWHAAELEDGLARLNDAVAATTAARQRLEAALTEGTARRRALEGKLTQAEASHQSAEQLWHAETAALADKLTQQQAEFSSILAEAVRARDAVAHRMTDALAAIEQARRDRAADAVAAAEHLAQRESALISKLDDAAATEARLERSLSDTESALRGAEQRFADATLELQRVERLAAAERQSAAEQAAQSRSRFETELKQETARRQAVEEELAKMRAASDQARLSFLSQLEDAATTQARLERSLSDNGSALRDAEQRLADATLELARGETNRQALEKALDAAAAAQRTTEQQAEAARQAAAEQAAESQSKFAAELKQETARRQAVEEELAKMRAASEQARLSFLSQLEDAATTQARLERSLSDNDSALRDADQRLADATLSLARAEQQATAERETAADDARRCQAEHDAELARGKTIQQALETELSNEIARHQAVENELADTRAASEQARLSLLEQLTATRQHVSRLEERAARERAESESTQAEDRERIQQLQIESDLARRSLAGAEEQTRQLQAARGEERANFECARLALEADLASQRTRLEGLVAERDTRLKTVAKELEATRSQRDALKTEAGLVPQLRKQLEHIRAESRGQFDNSPVNMCRLNRNGEVIRVNQALATLLGYDGPEHVQNTDLTTTVFEVAGELKWLVDRCLASRSLESVETTWRRRDGTRLIVRVLAVATSAESIDLIAQDLTAFRDLEEKLRYARRLEAVARYASEVAVNCESLLGQVREKGEHWLATLDTEAARHQGQSLLDEVTRVAGFLQQLRVVGNEQRKVPELVEVNKVLRDMAPVLKQVAGSNIELVLPKTSSPLNLDVEAERVERVLLNVAAYGRERMPLGGRMTIEVASVVLDRNFVAKHPNVRPGPHVLLTVNEVRGGVPPLPVHAQMFETKTLTSQNQGVDLGALQALVSDCGGHLWMMAEPPGDMVLKIHLPRRALDRPDTPPSKGLLGSGWRSRLPGIWH